ncbi:MAG: VOC family protein [Anaerolineae bacterium]|nr:VOC family protein [Anaerolineae bacterium]
MSIFGLHHITLVSKNAQRTVDFYVRVLGLRFIKQTVNFDDPTSYHLYFGDELGRPGTAITFFEWRDAPRGAAGIGGTHHFALTVRDEDGLLKWKRRLTDLGIAVHGPYDRKYFKSLYFDDPDGVHLEIATRGPGFTVDEPAKSLGKTDMMPPQESTTAGRDEHDITHITWPEPVPTITPDMALRDGMHHISAIGKDIARLDGFYQGVLGLELVKRTYNFDDLNSKHWYWGVNGGQPGTLITYFERDPKTTRIARMGTGMTHHFAFAVKDDETQLMWREKLLSAGIPVSEVRDRSYFHSIYLRDPEGHIVEIATLNPGFTVDEPAESLGEALKLPAQYESNRASIEAGLTPLNVPTWSKL